MSIAKLMKAVITYNNESLELVRCLLVENESNYEGLQLLIRVRNLNLAVENLAELDVTNNE